MRLRKPPLRVKNRPRTNKPLLEAKIPVTSVKGGETLPKIAIGSQASAVGSGDRSQAEGRLNAAGQLPVPAQSTFTAEPQAGAALGMRGPLILFKETADALGLPKDNLSVVLIAFTRFFALTPSAALIGTLRRELLSLSKTFSQETAGSRADQEAKAMTAVIAADKGVVLSSEALERYASYLLAPDSVDSDEDPPDRNENFNAEEMQKKAEELEEKDKLLGLLNSLPGKNGQYWKVFPFVINVNGVELRISLKILLGEALSSDRSEYLIADISSIKRQWRFFLKKNGDRRRADISVFPEYKDKDLNLLKKKAEQFLEGYDEIFVQNGVKIPSWAEDLFTQPLPSIDEEV